MTVFVPRGPKPQFLFLKPTPTWKRVNRPNPVSVQHRTATEGRENLRLVRRSFNICQIGFAYWSRLRRRLGFGYWSKLRSCLYFYEMMLQRGLNRF
jgi:hypothetical protein